MFWTMMFYFRDLIYVVSGVVFLHTIAVGFHRFLCKKSKGCTINGKGGRYILCEQTCWNKIWYHVNLKGDFKMKKVASVAYAK